jgi:hypothetical protein
MLALIISIPATASLPTSKSRVICFIKDIIKQEQPGTSSFLLYKKMTDDVTQMAGIQDSLFNTRVQLESIKTQLGSCLRVNHSAEKELSLGLFRRQY